MSNIEPPPLRRKLVAHNEWKKCLDQSRIYDLPIKNQLENPPPPRLVSRLPIWSDTAIQTSTYDITDQWKSFWNKSAEFSNKNLIQEPH